MDALWRQLLDLLVTHWVPQARVTLVCDDTLMKKSGRQIEGTGMYRDAVHSSHAHVVTARGLNIVVLALRVVASWGWEPLALPIVVGLHRKGGPTLVELAAAMLTQVATWLPEREFCLVADGAYAPLVGRPVPRTIVVSRMQRNVALFEPPSPRTGRRGRPRKKGPRLPAPHGHAATVPAWTRAPVACRGRAIVRDLWARPVLWCGAYPDRLVLCVIVRDPDGAEPDDFFVATDVTADAARVASAYADRWAIEDSFRNCKQFLDAEDPQTWVGDGPARGRAGLLALGSRLALVPRHRARARPVADSALVRAQADPVIRRRGRVAPHCDLDADDFRGLPGRRTPSRKCRHPPRRARRGRLMAR